MLLIYYLISSIQNLKLIVISKLYGLYQNRYFCFFKKKTNVNIFTHNNWALYVRIY